jgi:hypothetical protein
VYERTGGGWEITIPQTLLYLKVLDYLNLERGEGGPL